MAVSGGLARADDGGPEALGVRLAPGHPPRLTPDRVRSVPELLGHGPEASGSRGPVWTCARIAQVIEWECGARYPKDQVGRRLKGLRRAPPIKRAIERDQGAIRGGRDEVWPELRRRARRERRVLVSEDESGSYLRPGVVKTSAPEGLARVRRQKQTRDHLSVLGAMMPEGRISTLARPESLHGRQASSSCCIC